MSYDGYSALAGVYDLFNKDLDNVAWANYIEAACDRFLQRRPEILLDLACGTGRLTKLLADRGYDMIGVDGSAEMLAKAAENAGYDPRILYLLQDMRSFELYGTVGAVISCLDSINYLTKEQAALFLMKIIGQSQFPYWNQWLHILKTKYSSPYFSTVPAHK